MKSNFGLKLLFLCLFAEACNQNEQIIIDKEPPEVEILSPERNIIYSQGDTVFIKASIYDLGSLRNGSVHVHDQLLPSGSDTVFVYNFSMKKQNFELDTFCIVNDPIDKNYVIYFDAIDQAENITEKLRYFHQYH